MFRQGVSCQTYTGMNKGVMNIGTLEHWNIRTLEHWSIKTLEHWNISKYYIFYDPPPHLQLMLYMDSPLHHTWKKHEI